MSAQATTTTTPAPAVPSDEPTALSTQYDTPLGLAHTTMQVLKDRIKLHYDLASDYYLNLWGEHIHHGYWPTPASKSSESKETAQLNLIHLLLSVAELTPPTGTEGGEAPRPQLRILDVGCGVGGTTRYLASTLGAAVHGITISGKQVAIAERLSKSASTVPPSASEGEGKAGEASPVIPLGEKGGSVQFTELDAEKMGSYFSADGGEGFDVVWISEALSHFPDKALFFRNAHALLRKGGKLVLADWFKAEGLGEREFEADVKPIEDGMLLPPLCTQQGYVDLATTAGLAVLSPPKDISADVSKTWDISWSLVQNPSLWAFAFSQGRDGIAFLQAFRAMRRGYANGSFRYAVMSFVKH